MTCLQLQGHHPGRATGCLETICLIRDALEIRQETRVWLEPVNQEQETSKKG